MVCCAPGSVVWGPYESSSDMSGRRRTRRYRQMVRVGIPLVLAVLALGLALGIRRLKTQVASPYPIVATLGFDPDLVRSPVWVARADSRLATVDLPVEFSFRPGRDPGSGARRFRAGTVRVPIASQRVVQPHRCASFTSRGSIRRSGGPRGSISRIPSDHCRQGAGGSEESR